MPSFLPQRGVLNNQRVVRKALGLIREGLAERLRTSCVHKGVGGPHHPPIIQSSIHPPFLPHEGNSTRTSRLNKIERIRRTALVTRPSEATPSPREKTMGRRNEQLVLVSPSYRVCHHR